MESCGLCDLNWTLACGMWQFTTFNMWPAAFRSSCVIDSGMRHAAIPYSAIDSGMRHAAFLVRLAVACGMRHSLCDWHWHTSCAPAHAFAVTVHMC